jgi:hypothetical protein
MMQISTNYLSNKSQQSNPNFGALYMPKEKVIAKILGDPLVAAEAEKERPFLENLARDADIFVHPEKSIKGMMIFVQEITKPIVATGNWLARTLQEIDYQKQINSKVHFKDMVPSSPQDFGFKLYAKVLSLKINYDKFKKPNISPILRVRDVNPLDESKTPTPIRKAS